MDIFNKLQSAILLTALIVASCGRADNTPYYKAITEHVVGCYTLTGIIWEGDPVDLTGSGSASNNLYSQMMSLPVNAGNNHRVEVMNTSTDFDSGLIGMDLPMQGYCVSLDGQSYIEENMIGYTQPFSFSYQIDTEGKVTASHFDSFDFDQYDRRTELKKIHNGSTTFDLEGHAYFTAEHTLYDRKEHKLTDGIIQYQFTRIEE